MTTNEKGRTPTKDATQNDHGRNHSATAQKIGNPPPISKYRQKLNRRALAEASERPLAFALLAALRSRVSA